MHLSGSMRTGNGEGGGDEQKEKKKNKIWKGEWSNGMKYNLVLDPGATSVAVVLLVRAGSRNEPKEKWHGVAHFVEHMLFKSSISGTEKEMLRPLYEYGGKINAYTSEELTVYHINLAPAGVWTALDTLCEMFRGAQFDPTEINTERGVVISEAARVSSEAERWLFLDAFPSFVFCGEKGLDHNPIGKPSGLAVMDPDMLVAFFEVFYQPLNLCLSVCGSWDEKDGDLLDYVTAKFGQWKGAARSYNVVDPVRFAAYVSQLQLSSTPIKKKQQEKKKKRM